MKSWFVIGVLGLGVGGAIGHYLGQQSGFKQGLAQDSGSREILIAELETLTDLQKQQQLSLQTAEASIKTLTQNLDSQQREHEYDVRELELYRRIESAGKERGIKVDNVELGDFGQGAALRVTLMQIGARNDVKGVVGVALIGADLPGASENRLVIANPQDASGVEFDFRFMTRLSVPLPPELARDLPVPTETGDSEADAVQEAVVPGLDLIEIDLIPDDNRRRPKRVTVPADRMIVGPQE